VILCGDNQSGVVYFVMEETLREKVIRKTKAPHVNYDGRSLVLSGTFIKNTRLGDFENKYTVISPGMLEGSNYAPPEGIKTREVSQSGNKSADISENGKGVDETVFSKTPTTKLPIPIINESELPKWQSKGEKGDLDAQKLLGKFYRKRKTKTLGEYRLNLIEALKWYEMAAKQGDPSSERELGYLLHSGNGGRQNIEEAFNCFKSAASKGDVRAASMLVFRS